MATFFFVILLIYVPCTAYSAWIVFTSDKRIERIRKEARERSYANIARIEGKTVEQIKAEVSAFENK